jgi:hypothetical protein
MKHTKGKWMVIDNGMETHGRNIYVSSEDGVLVAQDIEGVNDEEVQANAHLIAAAPNLLKLAKMFEHHIMGIKVGENGRAFTSLELECFIRRMIQEAEGV